MKIWYLTCGCSKECAIVFAHSKVEAFEKMKAQRRIKITDIDYWKIEELSEEKFCLCL